MTRFRLVVLLFMGLLFVPGVSLAGKGMVPMSIKRVMLVNDAPAVLLVDREEESFLLVFIDFFMANSIRMGMEAPSLDRPLTHDLMGIFLRQLGANLKRVDITELKNNTYYALITLEMKGKFSQFDARPSDALALAVRNRTPIFVKTGLLHRFDQDPPADENKPQTEPKNPPGKPDRKKART